MSKEPRYNNVKFNVSDLELRKAEKNININKVPDKELKPCMNTMCVSYDIKFKTRCNHECIIHLLDCKKYTTKKQETTWDMWRRLLKKIRQTSDIEKRDKLLYRFYYIFSIENTDCSVRKMLVGFEKELKDD